MPLYPKATPNLHTDLDALLQRWRQDPSLEFVILAYGLLPQPFATLAREGIPAIALPLPANVTPYRDWNHWFHEYLEPEVLSVCTDYRVPLYIQGRRSLMRIERTLGD